LNEPNSARFDNGFDIGGTRDAAPGEAMITPQLVHKVQGLRAVARFVHKNAQCRPLINVELALNAPQYVDLSGRESGAWAESAPDVSGKKAAGTGNCSATPVHGEHSMVRRVA
jgi:hypothetical protein